MAGFHSALLKVELQGGTLGFRPILQVTAPALT